MAMWYRGCCEINQGCQCGTASQRWNSYAIRVSVWWVIEYLRLEQKKLLVCAESCVEDNKWFG